MDDDTTTPFNHVRHELPVQTNGRKEIEIELVVPLGIRQGDIPASRSRGTAEHMNNDVHASQPFPDSGGKVIAAFGRGQVCRDELDAIFKRVRSGPGACQHFGPEFPE